MKIDVNGVIRDMTPEEEAEYNRAEEEHKEQERQQPPSQLDIIESQLTYTALMTDTLIEGGE